MILSRASFLQVNVVNLTIAHFNGICGAYFETLCCMLHRLAFEVDANGA